MLRHVMLCLAHLQSNNLSTRAVSLSCVKSQVVTCLVYWVKLDLISPSVFSKVLRPFSNATNFFNSRVFVDGKADSSLAAQLQLAFGQRFDVSITNSFQQGDQMVTFQRPVTKSHYLVTFFPSH